ncbi:MAG: 50S ribosomal protein L25/general stress protein Ctc, partial [Devosia sp.]
YGGGFKSHIINVEVDGTQHRVIPRDYQLDVVKDKALHVDFLRVGPNTKLHVQVAVHFVNHEESPGIKKGGVLNIVHHTLDMTCPASAIPESITIDLTGKEVGDSIHLSDITLPKGTSVRSHEKDMTIATIAAPSAMRSEADAAPAEAAAAAPAAAAAAPAKGAAPAPAAGKAPAAKAPAAPAGKK